MNLGFLYMVISLTCFGLIGILVKFPDKRGCKASAVYALAYAWSILFGVCLVILFRGAEFHVPSAVYAIALPFGMMSAVGGIVFIAGVRYDLDQLVDHQSVRCHSRRRFRGALP